MTPDYEKYLKSIPVIPDVAMKVARMSEDNLGVSFAELENLIKKDPGLTVKVLKIANSSLYARQSEVKTLQSAIGMIGFRMIKSLVMLVSASHLGGKTQDKAFLKDFWSESLCTAFLGKEIALRCGQKNLAEDTFLAGLLHNIGQIGFLNADPQEYTALAASVDGRDKDLAEAEKSRYGFSHKQLGRQVMVGWNFPLLFADTALEHRSLNISSSFKTIILMVSLANILWESRRTGSADLATEAQKFAFALGLTPQDQDYFQSTYFSDLENSPLFKESFSLFAA